jgi:hypothetical protein
LNGEWTDSRFIAESSLRVDVDVGSAVDAIGRGNVSPRSVHPVSGNARFSSALLLLQSGGGGYCAALAICTASTVRLSLSWIVGSICAIGRSMKLADS